MLIRPVGLQFEKGCADDAQEKAEKYRPSFSSERAPHVTKCINV
jgi:hypothetical protein